MTISDTSRPLATPQLGGKAPIVDPGSGIATNYFLAIMQGARQYGSGPAG
jgi:hypothetical protein